MIQVFGNIINLFNRTIAYGELKIKEGRIFSITLLGPEKSDKDYICPGFIDSHVHIESSMLPPSEFARIAVKHGTIATVSDPHEIANVMGKEGVYYMINNGKNHPFKFYFGAPSCVPATDFETTGYRIGPEEVEELLKHDEILYLAEMMNFPGVINEDPEVIQKINIAKKLGKRIDGHAPNLRGEAAELYFKQGITTDHECISEEEAAEKIKLGVKILIREGSAAKNFDALIPLAINNSSRMMFCSDDLHPDELLNGHINLLVKRAIDFGIPFFETLQMACLNPVVHYGLNVGLLRVGDPADFIVINNLSDFKVKETFIDGLKVVEGGHGLRNYVKSDLINNFSTNPIPTSDLKVKSDKRKKLNVISCFDSQLITKRILFEPVIANGCVISDFENDVLKIVVYNRYNNQPPAIAFVNGFGLKEGAIASSVAHDSHNIIAVGVDDESIAVAINKLISLKGGIVAVSDQRLGAIPLPIAGLMSDMDAETIGNDYRTLSNFVNNDLGSPLSSPFMTLSFMALLVIPEIKLSDKGLFDGNNFRFINFQEN